MRSDQPNTCSTVNTKHRGRNEPRSTRQFQSTVHHSSAPPFISTTIHQHHPPLISTTSDQHHPSTAPPLGLTSVCPQQFTWSLSSSCRFSVWRHRSTISPSSTKLNTKPALSAGGQVQQSMRQRGGKQLKKAAAETAKATELRRQQQRM